MDDEILLCNGDPELGKLMIQRKLVNNRILERIDEIISTKRQVPYKVTQGKGVRINLNNFNLALLGKCCDKNNLEFEQDIFNCIGYIRPLSKGRTVGDMLPEIENFLKKCLKKKKR